jgi:hypothetical protein
MSDLYIPDAPDRDSREALREFTDEVENMANGEAYFEDIQVDAAEEAAAGWDLDAVPVVVRWQDR